MNNSEIKELLQSAKDRANKAFDILEGIDDNSDVDVSDAMFNLVRTVEEIDRKINSISMKSEEF